MQCVYQYIGLIIDNLLLLTTAALFFSQFVKGDDDGTAEPNVML